MTDGLLTHPAQDQLAAFAAGRLRDDESSVIEQHLADCGTCCQSLKHVPQDDSYVSLLRDALRIDRASGDSPTLAVLDEVTVGFTEPSTTTADLPPELLDHPRYRVLRRVGSGGMGEVYEAEHRLMRRRVALKIIKPQWLQSSEAVARFRREIQAAAKLVHPHVVTAFDAEQAESIHFLVMEFVEGMSLAEWIAQHGPLPVEVACECVRQAALGLQHAFEHGMVHRDIKPGNLVVKTDVSGGTPDLNRADSAVRKPSSNWTVKILDFGLARFASESPDSTDTSVGTLLGTPDFMAPEQARDARAADIRSDIYSLGCSLFFLLTGRVPHPSLGSAVEKALAHFERDIEPLANFRADIPPGVQAILNRMTAKTPAERYATPNEVALALAPFGRKTSWTNPSDEPAAHRPLTAGIKRVLAATGLVGFVLLMAVIVQVITDKGTLQIHSEVDGLRLWLSQDGERVRRIVAHRQPTTVRLLSGEYELALEPDALERGLTVEPKSVVLKRGSIVDVHLSLRGKPSPSSR